MTDDEFLTEYARLGHAIQTGVAHEITIGNHAAEPKHLRTGLNCVMQDLASLARLLIDKGVITEAEYNAAILDGLRREVDAYERRLSAHFGAAITLA